MPVYSPSGLLSLSGTAFAELSHSPAPPAASVLSHPVAPALSHSDPPAPVAPVASLAVAPVLSHPAPPPVVLSVVFHPAGSAASSALAMASPACSSFHSDSPVGAPQDWSACLTWSLEFT